MGTLDTLRREILFAARSLSRAPLFTAAVVLTLALGVAVNATVFAVVNALLLRPLPVPDGDRLVVIASEPKDGAQLGPMSFLDIEDYRVGGADVFEDVAGYNVGFLGLARDGTPAERVLATTITANYFRLLGVQPAAGRLIAADESAGGRSGAVAVLGYSAWQRRFGGTPAVVGSSVRIDGQSATIIGVAPNGFHGTFAFSDSELYLPLDWRRRALEDRAARGLHTFARLLPNVSIERAQATATVIAERLAREHLDSNAGLGVRIVPERLARPEEDQARTNALGATLMLSLVGLVTMLAAVNVTNLLLARVMRRRHDLAIRAALGAGRGQLARQLAVEVAALAVLGGCVGAVFAAWLTRALTTVRLPGDLPVRFDFGFDTRVTFYVAGVTLVTGLFAGLLPVLRASAAGRIRGGLPAAPSGGRRTRGAFVISQIALSFVLLVAAGLFARSLLHAERADLGFRPSGVVNVQLDVAQLGYDQAQGRLFFDEIASRVETIPGVDSVSFALTVPMGYVRVGAELEAERTPTERGAALSAGTNSVSPGYFETMGVALVRGRAFRAEDDEQAPPVAVVNERLASALWPGVDPIGMRFRQRDGDGRWIEVVGLVETGKYESLFEDPRPFFFLPQGQNYTALRVLHVRTTLEPESLLTTIERTIREAEPALALYDIQTMERALGSGPGLFPVRVAATATAALGGLALALAVIGTYAVVSYLTAQRTREIAIRMAVGSRPRDIARLVVRDGAGLVVIGIAAGIGVALALGNLLGRFLFDVSPRDVTTLVIVTALLGSVALLACAVPAWRAARVDPTVALRNG
jgi:predicted permease